MATFVNKRTAHRWRLLALMLAAVFCAFGSFWLLQMVTQQDQAISVGKSNEPDYIIDNFSFVRMGKKGLPAYVISGDRLTHRPIEDISYVDKPVMQSMTTEHPRMTLHADRARILHEQDAIELIGHVDLQRPGNAKVKPLSIKTEQMTVLPDEEIMKTDLPVEMKLGDTLVRGTGMVANNATQQVHLSSEGRMIIPPRNNR